MSDQSPSAQNRRIVVRAILIDDHGRIVLIKRTKPGQAAYWVTPGGGVEGGDTSLETALSRELAEELGAAATGMSGALVLGPSPDPEDAVQHFFVARLVCMDTSARHGPEYSDPSRGRYEPQALALRGEALAAIDLRPNDVKAFILAHREALLTKVGITP